MGLYADQVLPRAIDLALRGGEFAGPRARAAGGLDGEVLEIGFGSGLNIPYYPAGLKRVLAVDPAFAGRRLPAGRAASCAVPIEYVGSDAEALPVADASVDQVLSTRTLCTIPDAMQALGEVRGCSGPAARSASWSTAWRPIRVSPVCSSCSPRCSAGRSAAVIWDRRIDQLVAAAGLELVPGWRPIT